MAIKNDYILRLIESIMTFLGEVCGLKKIGKILEARELLKSTYVSYFGIKESTIKSLSFENLLHMLSYEKSLDPNMYYLLGKLIKEDALIYTAQEDLNSAIDYFEKSLRFHLHALKVNKEDLAYEEDLRKDIEEILEYTDDYELSYETNKDIFLFLLNEGKYDKAEDMLYNLLDQSENSQSSIEMGVAFYEELLVKSEEELEKGNLPMSEVIEGKNIMRNKLV